jgi:holin-like protein
MISWQDHSIVNSSSAVLTVVPDAVAKIPPSLVRNRWVQAVALLAIWLAAETASGRLHLPIPGSILGFFAVWALLETGALPISWIEQGADSLLDHLVLFFVPAMLALVGHPELLSFTGVKLLAAILIGTVLVMSGTAMVVELGFRWSKRESPQ